MGKLNPRLLAAGALLGACAAYPSTNAEALTKRFHPAICIPDNGLTNYWNFSETAGMGVNSATGGSDFFCPITETTGFLKENVTEARVYFQQQTSAPTGDIEAKVCKTNAYTTTPLASFVCSNASSSSTQGFGSFAIADLDGWDTTPYELLTFPYIHITAHAGSTPNTQKTYIRGIRLTY